MMREKLFAISSEEIARAGGPLVRILIGEKGLPIGACAAGVVDASADTVWKVVSDVSGYAERVPLMDRVNLHGDWAEFCLKLKIAFFSVRFSFSADIEREQGRALVLSYRAGEPKDIRIEYQIEPLEDGRTLVFVQIGFDVESLGWLVKYFLRHHPEIQFGIFPGCALALLDALGGAFVSAKLLKPSSAIESPRRPASASGRPSESL
jgi:ribosome-associated toxin RatA of RatAB toxin-antitoxin module